MTSRASWVVALLIAGVVAFAGLLVAAVLSWASSPEMAVGLVGVLGGLVGGGVAGLVSFVQSNLDRENQLRMAALDGRLAAHQEAYALCWRLRFPLKDSSLHQVTVECQEWWKRNCLFLESKARRAFYDASIDPPTREPANDFELKWMREFQGQLDVAMEAIERGAALPPLKEPEREGRGRGSAR